MAKGNKKKKKNVNYTIITIPDRPEYQVTQKRTSRKAIRAKKTFRAILIVAALGLFLAAGYLYYNSVGVQEKLNQKIDSLNASIEEKDSTITDLESKVGVLSGVVEQMTQKASDEAASESQKHLPTGLPIGGTSSYKEDFDASTSAPILIFEGAENADVLATAAGTVTFVGSDDEYLNVVMIDHGNGYTTVYRNRSTPKVSVGSEVITGSILYILGPDSRTLGYQIMQDGDYIDPADLMQVFG